jgi:hypothetical protein
MFLRTSTLIVAGAMLAGCEDAGVNGVAAYRPGVDASLPEHQAAANRDMGEARTASARMGPSTNPDAARPAAGRGDWYPSDAKATGDIPFTAVVSSSGDALKIVNPTDRDVRDAKVWVNGSYVAWVSEIPPRGTASVRLSDFTDSRGNTLSDAKAVRQIQVNSRDGVYNVQGPAFDSR